MLNGFPLTSCERARIAREAAERFERNSTIECVRSLYEKFKADVAVQTKGASGDWSGFTVGLEELEDELPAMEG